MYSYPFETSTLIAICRESYIDFIKGEMYIVKKTESSFFRIYHVKSKNKYHRTRGFSEREFKKYFRIFT